MPDFGFGLFLLKRKVAPEFKNSGATFSTTLYIFKECTYFETKVEDGLSDSRKAGCRRSGGSLHKSRAWQKTYAPARTQSAVLSCTSVSSYGTFLCLAKDICTSQDTVSGTFLYFCIFIQYFSLPGRRLMHQPGRCLWYFSLNCASFRKKKTVPRAGPEMYFS